MTGIQADLRVFEALGVQGLCAVTEVLAAGGGEVRRTFQVPPRIVEAQIDAVAQGGMDAAKISGLRDRTLVESVAERVRRRSLGAVLLDPGILDAAGERRLGRNGVDWLRRRLLPRIGLVVLEGAETEILADAAIDTDDIVSIRSAMERVHRSGAAAIAMRTEDARAWVVDTIGFRPLDVNVPAKGLGRDPFLAAVTVRLALGSGIEDAFHFAGQFVEDNAEEKNR